MSMMVRKLITDYLNVLGSHMFFHIVKFEHTVDDNIPRAKCFMVSNKPHPSFIMNYSKKYPLQNTWGKYGGQITLPGNPIVFHVLLGGTNSPTIVYLGNGDQSLLRPTLLQDWLGDTDCKYDKKKKQSKNVRTRLLVLFVNH